MKTILITGISRGLGKELFDLFLAEGHFVFGVLRNAQEAKKLEQELPDNGKLIQADLSSDESIEAINEVVRDTPIDLLINNAGISGRAFLLDETASEEILDLLNVHCLGAFRAAKALRKNLLQAEQATVLNLNSRFGSITRQSQGTYQDLGVSYSYRIAKAAQNMLTNCLRVEFRDQIKFISLHPGKMKTAIAQTDANVEPGEIAQKILNHFEQGKFKEENGILELEKELIEW